MSCTFPSLCMVGKRLIGVRGRMGRVFGCIWMDLLTTSTRTKFWGFKVFKANIFLNMTMGLFGI